MKLRIVFMGTPEFALPSLEALYEAGYEIAGVFCQPDRPSGRGKKVSFSPVKEYALAHGIAVYQPLKIRQDGAETLQKLQPDLCVTAAFGQILSKENLLVPRLGTINVHASLLPKYRGSAPINWALIQGETVTGVTTMLTDQGLDTGDILLQQEVPIQPGTTAGDLTRELSNVGAELLLKTIRLIEEGHCPRIKQNEEEMSYYPMLTKETGHINFTCPAEEIIHLIQGVSPKPGAYALAEQDVIKIWAAEKASVPAEAKQPGDILAANPQQGLLIQAGAGTVLRVLEVQMPGGKRMNVKDYLRGHSFPYQRLT